MRGVAGVDLTEGLARDLGAAAAAVAGPGCRVVLGRDTRESGPALEESLVDGIVSGGGVALTAGVIPTPGVAMLVGRLGAELGCVISASHNPYEDNGIKFLGADGRKLPDAAEADVEAAMGSGPGPGGGRVEPVENAGRAVRRLAGGDLRRRRLAATAGWCSTARTAPPPRPRRSWPRSSASMWS